MNLLSIIGSSSVFKRLSRMTLVAALVGSSALVTGCRNEEIAAAAIGGVAGLVIGSELARPRVYAPRYREHCRMTRFETYDRWGYPHVIYRERCRLIESATGSAPVQMSRQQIGEKFGLNPEQTRILMEAIEHFGQDQLSPDAASAGLVMSQLQQVFTSDSWDADTSSGVAQLARAMNLPEARLVEIIRTVRAEAVRQQQAADTQAI